MSIIWSIALHWLLADWIAEVPAHQPTAHPPQRQHQRIPLHPLNSPARARTSKTHGEPKATGRKTVQGTQQECGFPSTVNTRARRGNATCLTQGTRASPVGQGMSDSEEGRPLVSPSLNTPFYCLISSAFNLGPFCSNCTPTSAPSTAPASHRQ